VKPYALVKFLVCLLIFTSNKKKPHSEVVSSDSGPTIPSFNLQK